MSGKASKKSVIIATMNGQAGPASSSFKADIRHEIKLHHLLAANRLSEDVYMLEKQNRDKPFGDFFNHIFSSSSGCVVLSVASTEAYINSIFSDRHRHFSKHDNVTPKQSTMPQRALDLLWEESERKGLREKFHLATRLRTDRRLQEKNEKFQSFDALIHLRNALIHFKPEWASEKAKHAKLSDKLKKYISPSPWYSSESLFPYGWASASTSSWCISTVFDFIQFFSEQSGIPNSLMKYQDQIFK